jgi:hypothetical protein
VSPGAARPERAAQAWVELNSADPSAQTALGAIRAHLPGGQRLLALRRARLFELRGGIPTRARLEDLLHRSAQFYNPHKERCVVRRTRRERLPVGPGDCTVLVWERDGARVRAAERWLEREAGRAVEVREGTVWVLSWDATLGEAERLEATRELALVRDRRHGLLANPNAQEAAVHAGPPPLPALR